MPNTRLGKLFQLEQGRAMNEKSQFCGSLITYNKITSNSSETWNQVPYFRDFVDEYFRSVLYNKTFNINSVLIQPQKKQFYDHRKFVFLLF